MSAIRSGRLGLVLLGWLLAASHCAAQREPHIGYLFPAGGQQGKTFEVIVGGQFLDGATNIYFSGSGIEAQVLDHDKPMPQKRVNEIREKMQEVRTEMQQARKAGRFQTPAEAFALFLKLATDKGVSREELVKAAEFRIQRNDPKRQLNPQLSETVRLQVTLTADADPGVHEIRVAGRGGLSNPMAFRVGHLPEVCEPRQGVDLSAEYLRELRLGQIGARGATAEVLRVSLPAVVNGQILPGEVDRWQFTARKGQQLVAAIEARALIPYLADAVPGWFQATLSLKDARGEEIAYADDFRFQPDPVLCFQIPKDGQYVVEIKDAIYRGREDFVYRLTLGEVPFVTGIFPLGGPVGQTSHVSLKGWNLGTNMLTFDARGREPGRHALGRDQPELCPNSMLFAVDDLPETTEASANEDRRRAQNLALPVIVNGRIETAGDVDVFRFDGRAGDRVVAEVNARRLNSPLDSVLKLTDAEGRQLAFNDDHTDKGAGLMTHHADSYLSCTLPAEGTYYVHLADVQGQGGSGHAYRLRLSAPRPDFELRLVPASLNARPGTILPLTVYALRKDGFAGDIPLSLKEAPKGFVLDGGWVPAGQDQVRLTLTVPASISRKPCPLELEGRAIVDGVELVRKVVPAEDMMQAFFYRHLVPAEELLLAQGGEWRRGAAVRMADAQPIRIPAGGTTTVRLSGPAKSLSASVELELDSPPEGITLHEYHAVPGGAELVLAGDPDKLKPGFKGNLLIGAYAAAGQGKPANPSAKRTALGILPAIPFEVVAVAP